MSRLSHDNQQGFTLIELTISMVVLGVVFTTFGVFFNNYLRSYSDYQINGTNFTQAAQQSERMSNVLRGLTDIESATATDLTAYAYFAPADQFVSLVRYYYDAPTRSIIAEVTRMSANPPVGVSIPETKQSYTIVENYILRSGASLFEYFDAGGGVLGSPVVDQRLVQSIRVNLVVDTAQTDAGQEISVSVSLRNRRVVQ